MALFMVGAAMIYRGVTGFCRVYQALGITHANGHARERGTGVIADRGSDTRSRLGGRRGIHVEEAVTINRPVSEVYRFWRNFENLPRFMRHLESVAMREEGISRWVATGPGRDEGRMGRPDHQRGSQRSHRLAVARGLDGGDRRFRSLRRRRRGTRVRVNLQYSPPAGKLGSVVARLFGEEPSVQIREDLQRLKMLLERPT
jgi:uncharacterized membrane protein